MSDVEPAATATAVAVEIEGIEFDHSNILRIGQSYSPYVAWYPLACRTREKPEAPGQLPLRVKNKKRHYFPTCSQSPSLSLACLAAHCCCRLPGHSIFPRDGYCPTAAPCPWALARPHVAAFIPPGLRC